VAKKYNDKKAFSKSGRVAEAQELMGEDLFELACPNCGAFKVGTSRPQAGDLLRSLLVPAKPFRCLDCYQRFWFKENFFSNNKRVFFWLALLSLMCSWLFFATLSYFSNGRELAQKSKAEVVSGAAVNTSSASIDKPLSQNASETDASRNDTRAQITDYAIPPDGQVSARGINAQFAVADDQSGNRGELNDQPLLTLEQQKEQVRLAKLRAELAAKQSQEKLAQIEDSLAPDSLEIESLAKIEVGYALEQWRNAWAKGDVRTYLQYYSPYFEPGPDMSRADWETQRIERVLPSKKINLKLTEFEMNFADQMNKAYVEFKQGYESGSYSEVSRKQLVLSKDASGWKILSEIELDP